MMNAIINMTNNGAITEGVRNNPTNVGAVTIMMTTKSTMKIDVAISRPTAARLIADGGAEVI